MWVRPFSAQPSVFVGLSTDFLGVLAAYMPTSGQLVGACGHKKGKYDNHVRCLRCHGCSRDTVCDTCALWSSQTWDLAGKSRTYAKRKASSSGSTSGSGKAQLVSQKPVPVGDFESGRKTQQIAVSSHPPSSAGRPHSGPVYTTSRDAGSVVSGTSASPAPTLCV